MATRAELQLFGTPAIDPNRVYRLAEACRILQISDTTMRRWLKSGFIRGAHLGHEWRFLGSHLIDSLNKVR